jgi:hypothetical protein
MEQRGARRRGSHQSYQAGVPSPYAALIATTSQSSSITISCTISQAIHTTRLHPFTPLPEQRHVPAEQNNWSHVRQLFGYDRFENAPLADLMNDVYAHEWSPLHRHFCTPKLSYFDQTASGQWLSILWAAMRFSE